MNRIANSPIGWICTPLAILNEKTATAKNALSSMTSGLLSIMSMPDELIKLVERCEAIILLKDFSVHLKQVVDKINPIVLNALPTLKAVNSTLEVTKDYLTFLEFFGYVKDCGDPELSKKSFAKKANLVCKLGFSSIETFLLIPKKFNWIDLGKFCETIGSYSPYLKVITPVTLKLTSNVLVLGSSVFAIWGANQDMKSAEQAKIRNTERMEALEKLRQFQVNGGSEEVILEAMKTHLSQGKVEEKMPKLIKTYAEVINLSQEIKALNNQINDLTFHLLKNANKIAELTKNIETKKVVQREMLEKARRTVAFYKEATGIDLSAEALQIVKNKLIHSMVLANIHQIQNPQKKAILTQLCGEQPDGKNEDKSLRNYSANIHAALKASVHENDDNFLNRLTATVDDCINSLASETRVSRDETIMREIVDYKIKKLSRDYVINDAKITRSQYGKTYEITKIAIVTFVTIGLLITHAMAPAIFVTYAAAFGTATWISGISICIAGLKRTIFETFYWKDPKELARPTTNLGRNLI